MSDSEAMSDSGSDSRSKIDKVGWQLGHMSYQYGWALGQIFRTDANDKMVDELIERNELIDQLESSLLPSIKDHINSLLLALDLQNSGKQLTSNLDLISEITRKIDDTLMETTDAVESVSAPFEDQFTNARNLGRCKEVRCRRLHTKVRNIIIQPLCSLFESGAEFMRFWELSRKDPESLEYRKKMSEWMEEAQRASDISYRLIDQTIEWSRKSDLVLLQEIWLEAEESINHTLEDLTGLADPMIDFEHEQIAIDEPERTRTPREHSIDVARLTIPIIKLTRIFFNKIISTTTKKPLFTLDPGIDSESLEQLIKCPSKIVRCFQDLARYLETYTEEDTLDGHRYSNPFVILHKLLDSTLLLLSFHLVPLPPPVEGHSLRQNHFKAWFLDFQSQYHRATDRMLDVLYDSDPLEFNSDLDSHSNSNSDSDSEYPSSCCHTTPDQHGYHDALCRSRFYIPLVAADDPQKFLNLLGIVQVGRDTAATYRVLGWV
ncbi:hypothetical protein PGTUg99_013721 [Puccinia graminis f. sp. tritici]|uniref:Uncharacterized protein n=2 Tax=Puccinia graminis f. sp. tritici TaxID=56615 RepID=A0A5B0MPM3_PUCGR|nr:hypothetical protein PGTUg99_013721 [Puccinia graminis f. sp. tritici]